MKKLSLVILFFCCCYGWAQTQGNMVSIGQIVPSQLTICGETKLFTVTIYNPSPFLITGGNLSIALPTGILYQSNSLTGGTFLNSFGGIVKATLPDIPTLTSHTVTFLASAQCNVLTFINSGGIIKNTATLTYTANSMFRFDSNISATYLIRQPNLAITTISNQSYQGNIGATFTRCITVVNGGLGELSAFTVTDIHAAGIQINSVNIGTLTHNGLTAKIDLNGTHFTSIGDGDNLFESGESISICESVTINDCISGISNLKAFWGCSVNACQSAIATANVVFPNYVPNLVVTPTGSINSCIGLANASPQALRIVNAGLGKAINFNLDIFQSTSSGYNASVGSYIDHTSFTIKTGLSGTPAPITPTFTQNTNNLNCMSGNKGRVTLNIATINPGDTLYLNWNTYSCCFNACTSTGQRYINGWRYKGTYTNLCQNNYVLNETWGKTYNDIYGALTPDGAPSTLSNGQTGIFTFLWSNYGNSYPVAAGSHWKFEFTLPNHPCLSYSNIRIIRANGASTWTPSSVTTSGNVVTAIFNTPVPFTLAQAELKIDLYLQCSLCTGTEEMTGLSVKSYYIPDGNCGCEIGVSCQNIPFNINCPDPCPAGILFANFDMSRTSYGLPDNEANGGNGIPDGSGSLNFSRVKTNRAMFGDTITSNFYGTANTNIDHPSLQYGYAVSSISNGNLFTFLDATLKIYRGGTLTHTCTGITPTIANSGNTREFTYDISVPTLITNGCLPGGYVNTDNDSLVLTARYKITTNIGNVTPINCFATNKFYLSENANPTLAADKLQCGTINGNVTVIGYWFRNWEGDNNEVNSCNTTTISQNYFLSIGPGWNNDAGGNLFPYEYRNWAHIENLTAVIPHGYDFVSARFRDERTSGTLLSTNSGWITITPVDSTSDTLEFNVEQYFQGYGGALTPSDDGFYGVFQVFVKPSCEVTPGVELGISHKMDFSVNNYLTGLGSDTTSITRNDDLILFNAPDIIMQAQLPSILAMDSLETWDVLISNPSNVSNAENTWIAGSNNTGVHIVKVEDLGTNLPITPIGDVYPVGTIPAMGTRTFRITASYTSCYFDSLNVYAGWNCGGYPASISAYPCPTEKIQLTLTPLLPGFVIDATILDTAINMCDTATFIATCSNAQLGTAYHVTFTAILPTGTAIVPGSSEISFPDSTAYTAMANPVFIGNSRWQWNISAADSLINSDGVKGILDSIYSTFKIRFKVTTACGYIPGNNINFYASGVAACGDTSDLQIYQAPDLRIIGLNEPYSTSIKIVTTYVSPCATNSLLKLVITNHGPTAFGNTDSVSFKLPGGVSYVGGSFTGIHNAPVNGTPVISNIGGYDYLIWRLPAGVVAGDSTVFTFEFSGEPVLLSCGIVYFEAQTRSSNTVVCTLTGQDCITNLITGDTSLAVFIYKAYLTFANGSAVSVPNPPGGETVTMTFDITNTGQAIAINADSVIQYYFDADGDSTYSIGDIFIAQDTVLVPRDSTITYTTTFDAPAGQACAILAVVDPGVNNCACDPTHIRVEARLTSLGNDTIICSGETVTMSRPPVTGYTYSWTPSTNLNDSTLSDALLTASNLTTNPVTTEYYLSTNRIGCSALDTIAILVNPLPIASVTGDTTVCKGSPAPGIVFTGAVGEAPYTFTYTVNGGTQQTVVSNGDTAVVPAPTDSVGTFIYRLVSVKDSSLTLCSQLQNDSATIIISPLPTAIAFMYGDSAVCQGGSPLTVAFVGSGGTPPYTFTYSINGSATQTVVSTSGDTAFVSQPTATGGQYVYKIINIDDGSINTCGQAQNDSIIAYINPLPEAVITGAIGVCKDATPPLITFIGTTGTAPFTFTYNVNGGTNTTVTSTSGDTAFVPAPTANAGTFTYNLISVQDSGSTVCFQPQTGSVIVTVDPLPSATIHGSVVLCQYSQAPAVKFVGHGGVAPYTFMYNLNGVLQPSITTITGDSITISVATNDTGTFVYELISVQDANIATCTHPETGDATVRINPKPLADFTSNIVCNGNNTELRDTSSTIAGSIISWTWDFGNSSPLNTTQHPVFIYPNAGVYNVTLIAGNSYGCTDTVIKEVEVYYNPVVSFTHNDVCLGDTIYFTNTSTVDSSSAIANYIWVFGDSSPTSNLVSPKHKYTNAGTYNVTLVATTVDGCSGVSNETVKTFDPPTTAFQFSNTCLFDSAVFTNTSLNPTMGTIGAWSWNFGDGSPINTSTLHPHHRYPAAGDYEVTLITHSSNLGCADTLKDTITVYPMPIADYSSTDVCLHDTTYFYDSSTVSLNSVTNWSWNFGDLTSLDTSQHPTHVYSAATTYAVQLICTTTNGCKDTVTHNVVVHPLPFVNFNEASVCDGTSVNFNDATTIPTTDTLASWIWNFGDANAVSANQNTSHLYPAPGSYTTQLTVTSTFGCIDSISKTTIVHPNPVVGFTQSDTAGCEPLCVVFKDNSNILTGANTGWAWNFGDGSPSVTGDSVRHCYYNDSVTATTSYAVTLTVTSDNGCISTYSQASSVDIHPKPVANFSVSPTSETIINAIFTISDSSIGTDMWHWYFGNDDSLYTSDSIFTYEYTDTGHYVITLITTTQNGCLDTAYQNVTVTPDFVFYIPNSFTPNNDGINDSFSGKGIFITKYEMRIFDRWGNEVFYTDDYNKPWNGTVRGGKEVAQRDVYVYLVTVTDIYGYEHIYRGTVTLVN